VVRGDGRVIAGAQCLQRLVGIRTAGGHLTLHAPQLRAAGGGGAAVVVGAAARLLGLVPQPAGPIPRPAGLLVVLVGRLCGRPRLLQPSRDPAGDLSQRGQPIDRVTPLRFDGAQLRDPLTQHHLGPVEPLQLRGASGQPLIGRGGLGRAVLDDPGEPVEVTRRVFLQPDPQPLPQGRVGADPVGQRGEPAEMVGTVEHHTVDQVRVDRQGPLPFAVVDHRQVPPAGPGRDAGRLQGGQDISDTVGGRQQPAVTECRQHPAVGGLPCPQVDLLGLGRRDRLAEPGDQDGYVAVRFDALGAQQRGEPFLLCDVPGGVAGRVQRVGVPAGLRRRLDGGALGLAQRGVGLLERAAERVQFPLRRGDLGGCARRRRRGRCRRDVATQARQDTSRAASG
jgi:hypothetical protein